MRGAIADSRRLPDATSSVRRAQITEGQPETSPEKMPHAVSNRTVDYEGSMASQASPACAGGKTRTITCGTYTIPYHTIIASYGNLRARAPVIYML